jgi:hypothetical protein
MCTVYVALGGDENNIVYRDHTSPVSWPEIGVLQYTHGEEAVFNPEVVGEVDTTCVKEKKRLELIYGPGVVNEVYPGRSPMFELNMPGGEVKKVEKKTDRRLARDIGRAAEPV